MIEYSVHFVRVDGKKRYPIKCVDVSANCVESARREAAEVLLTNKRMRLSDPLRRFLRSIKDGLYTGGTGFHQFKAPVYEEARG